MKNCILIIFVILIHNFGYAQEKLPEFEETIKWIISFVNSGELNYTLSTNVNSECETRYLYKIEFDDYVKLGKTEVKLSEYKLICDKDLEVKFQTKLSETKFNLDNILEVSEIQLSEDKLFYGFKIIFKKTVYMNLFVEDYADYKKTILIDSRDYEYFQIGEEKIITCTDKGQLERLRKALSDIILQVSGSVNKKLY